MARRVEPHNRDFLVSMLCLRITERGHPLISCDSGLHGWRGAVSLSFVRTISAGLIFFLNDE